MRLTTLKCMDYSWLYVSSRICGMEDRTDQADVFIQAQILLTAFVVGLEPIVSDHASVATLRTGPGQITTCDA
jgi:hypothetical protein